MSCSRLDAVYRPRRPRESPLWQLLNDRFEDFLEEYQSKFQKRYGYFRSIILEVVKNFLQCGDLRHGFARIRCSECKREYLLAFSCRGRWFCPSCHAKIVVQFGERLRREILYPVPHRQYVFSIPIIIRSFFRYDRKLLGRLCQCVNRSLTLFFKKILHLQDGVPGMVMVIHTFGDYARWHPHVHVLTADGLFRSNGMFYVMPKKSDTKVLGQLFRASVLTMLKEEGIIDEAFIQKVMKWRHCSGFSVYRGMQVKRDDEAGKEALAQYIIRNPFSLEKIRYNPDTGTVIYRSGMTHGRNKKNFEIFPATEFIAAITQHIPEKSFQLVRYYGWYSNRSRGDRAQGADIEPPDSFAEDSRLPAEAERFLEIIDTSLYRPLRIPSKTWRECIKKIWEVDPLECPRCGVEMKIISFITPSQPNVIRRILEHLGLWIEGEEECRPPPKRQEFLDGMHVCEGSSRQAN